MTGSPTSPERPADTATFGERLQAMRQSLDEACRLHTQTPLTHGERDALKQAIIGLFREADAAWQQAQGWKDAVKSLAEQWKQLDERPATGATPAASAPVAAALQGTGRVDHLGASTFIEKGWSKLSLLDASGAEAAFRRALELAPGNTEAETLLSWALMQQERHDEAMQVLQVVLQRDPHYSLAHANVGFVLMRKRLYGEAIEHLATVVRADADRRAVLYAHLYLGMAYREREMYEDAERFFRRALELGPNLLQAWYELGLAYWFAGRRGDARLAWKSGSEANKFSPWGKRCTELLQSVEIGGEPPRDG